MKKKTMDNYDEEYYETAVEQKGQRVSDLKLVFYFLLPLGVVEVCW